MNRLMHPLYEEDSGKGGGNKALIDEITATLGRDPRKKNAPIKEEEEEVPEEVVEEEPSEIVEDKTPPIEEPPKPPKEPEEGSTEWYKKQYEEGKSREENYLKTINNLSAGEAILGLGGDTQMPGQPPSPAGQQAPVRVEPVKEEETSVSITEEEYNDAMSSVEGFNKIVKRIYDAGREVSLRSIAKTSSKVVAQQLQAQKTVDAFLEANPDLRPIEKYVGQIVTEMHSDNPNLKPDELLTKAGEEARKRLGMPAPVKSSDNGGQRIIKKDVPGGRTLKPALGTPGVGKPHRDITSNLTDQQKHMAALFPKRFKQT